MAKVEKHLSRTAILVLKGKGKWKQDIDDKPIENEQKPTPEEHKTKSRTKKIVRNEVSSTETKKRGVRPIRLEFIREDRSQ